MTSSTTVQIPGYVVGTWDIDAAHSTVGFSVRHMMVSKVRGYFREFSGELVCAMNVDQAGLAVLIHIVDFDRPVQHDEEVDAAVAA